MDDNLTRVGLAVLRDYGNTVLCSSKVSNCRLRHWSLPRSQDVARDMTAMSQVQCHMCRRRKKLSNAFCFLVARDLRQLPLSKMLTSINRVVL